MTKHKSAYRRATENLGFKLTGIDVADSTTKEREEKAG